MIFENYPRSEQSLLTTMAVMVLEGVSTRKIAQHPYNGRAVRNVIFEIGCF